MKLSVATHESKSAPHHLPEEKVLSQLGIDQLCLLVVTTRKLAIFARSHGPVALIDAEMSGKSSAMLLVCP